MVKTPSENMTIKDILAWRNIPEGGTAVALNDRLVQRARWNDTYVAEEDNLAIISAAYGG